MIKCICDITAFGKVLRADCPECGYGVGRNDVAVLRPENRPLDTVLKSGKDPFYHLNYDHRTFNLTSVLETWMREAGWVFDKSTLRFTRGEEWLTIVGACELYQNREIELPSEAKNQKGEPVRTCDGIMNYITANSPWDSEPFTESKLKAWIETALEPVGLECPTEPPAPGEVVKSYKTSLGTIDIIKGLQPNQDVKVESEVPADPAELTEKDLNKWWDEARNDPVVTLGRVAFEKEPKTGWHLEQERQYQRAIALLRTWRTWLRNTGFKISGLAKETEEFLKEIEDAEQK